MPSNNKNKGFAVPGEFGRRLAYASDTGVLVRPTPAALEQIYSNRPENLRFQRLSALLEGLPEEGKRIRCGHFTLSERTHSIIEGGDRLGADSRMLAPAITAPEGYELVEISVGWVEFDMLVHYSGSKDLKATRLPGVNTWSAIAEACGAPRDQVKMAIFTAIYGGAKAHAEVSSTWETITARYPELRALRDDTKDFGPAYLQRRANDWRTDLYEKVIDVVYFPIVFVGPGNSGIYFEVPSAAVELTVTLIKSLDPHIDARSSTTLAGFYGASQTA